MSAVMTPAFRLLKSTIATLCVALAFAFAGASAASVVNRVQHQVQPLAGHAHLAFSDIALTDADVDANGDASPHDGNEASPPNHDPDVGHHHHLDAPAGLLAGDTPANGSSLARNARVGAQSDELILGSGAPGPERPPKLRTSRV